MGAKRKEKEGPSAARSASPCGDSSGSHSETTSCCCSRPSSSAEESSCARLPLSTATPLACRSPSRAETPPRLVSSIEVACSPARISRELAACSAATRRPPLGESAPRSASHEEMATSV